MANILGLSYQKFEITMVNILRTPMWKVDSMQEKKGSISSCKEWKIKKHCERNKECLGRKIESGNSVKRNEWAWSYVNRNIPN